MPSVNIQGVGTVNFPDDMSPDAITKAIETDILPKYGKAKEPEPEGGIIAGATRGFTSYLPQLQETLGGAQVLAGKAFGSEDIMRAGLERMKAAKEELGTKYKETDSFTKALDKGIGAVLTDWLPYQVGSGAANLVESLAVMGAGMTFGSAVPGVGTAVGGVTGLLEKELVKKGVKEAAEKIAKEMGEEAAKKFTEDQIKVAAKSVAKKVAGTTALAAQAGFHGAGETTSRAVEEAERLGKEAADIDLERVLPSALVHGTAEFIGDKIGLGAFSKLDGATKSLLLNFSKNLLTTGTKEAPVEVVQSMAERFGAKMSLTDAEAVKEYIDSAAAAYGMSVLPSAGGAVRQKGEARLKEDVARQAEEAKAEAATAKAKEETAKIDETAVPGPTGEVEIPTFTPLVGGENVEQPARTVDGTSEPSATDAARGEAVAAGEPIAPDTAGVVPAGGVAEPVNAPERIQPAALNKIPYDTVEFAGEGQPLNRSSGSSDVINYGGRMIVMRNVNGVMVPFYLSTGAGGKTDVASGKWYPFFGIGADGWINKTGGAEMTNYYGSEALKQAAQELDSTIGDIRNDNSIPKASRTGQHIDFINQNLNPAENEKSDTLTKVRENINNVINAIEGKENVAETTLTEPAVVEQPTITEPAVVGQPIAETAEGAAPEASVEPVSPAATEVVEEPAVSEVTEPVTEKKDYAATERVFSKEQTPFVTANVKDRASIPRTIDEAANYAAAETAFDFYDSAESGVDAQLETMAQEQGKTVDEVAATMPEQQLFNMFYENVNTEGLPPERQRQVEARDAFIKTLSEEQRAAIRKKAIEAFHTEIRAKRAGKRITDADKRKLRERTYDATEAKRILRAKKKAEAEVKAAEKEPTVKERKEAGKTQDQKREYKVRTALETGDIDNILGVISDTRLNDSVTAQLASKIAKIIKAAGITPNVIVGEVKGDNVGQYDPATDTITIDLNKLGTQRADIVVLHETMHHLADWAVDNPQSLNPEQKRALTELKNLYNHVNAFLGDQYPIGSLKEFIAQAFSNPKFQVAMGHLPPVKQTSVLKEFAKQIMRMLGFRDRVLNESEKAELKNVYGATLGDVLSQIEIIISGPRSGVADGVSYMSKPAEEVKDRTFSEMADQMKSEKPTSIADQAKKLVTTTKGTETLVRKFQNDRVAIKRWQDRLMMQGRIISYGLGFNNIYDQITLSSGNAHWTFTQHAENTVEDLRNAVTDYAKEYNLSTDDALKQLGLFAIAQHYDERRRILYMKTVPLSDAKILQDAKGNPISPEAARAEIFKTLDSAKLTDAQIKQLRAGLESIVFAPNNQYLSTDKKDVDKLDITSTKYDVAGAYTDAELATVTKEYEARKASVDKVLEKVKKLNKINTDLNKEANYLSGYADNWIKFYDWQNYIPLKGKALSEEAELLNFDSRKLGGELQDVAYTFEGRITPPDNPILQIMADSALASLRVGRKDVTEAIYNAVQQKLIKGSIKELSFFDRNNLKKLEEYKGESKVFHYMDDGRVAVIQIDDQAQREAIRRTYKETHPLVDRLNKATSLVGQLHTRYNVAFAPVNFVRDVLTNAYTLGAELGPAESFRYLGAIASGIVRQQYKAGKFSYLYARGDTAKINELADKDDYYKDLMEYVKTGGRVSYIAGLAPKGQYEELYRAAGSGKVLTTKAQINKFFDMWIDSFELTARVAAYRLAKSNEKAELVRAGKSDAEAEAAARIKAAAYAKNLANFEQIGEWGRGLGAWFMFFRPAATGAVRAMEAIAPAFMDVRQAKYRLPEYAQMVNLKAELKAEKYEGKKKEEKEKKLAELERGLDEFEKNFTKRKDSARATSLALIGIGSMVYMMSKTMADDDDLGRNKVSTDDMTRWTRFARFFLPGTDTIVQMPWGFGLGAFAALGAQVASIGDSNTKMGDTLANMVVIAMDSFLPLPISRIPMTEKPLEFGLDTITPSIVRPLVEYVFNVDALGRQIYNNRQTRFGDAYTGGDNIPEVYKMAARNWFDSTNMDVAPNTLYFFANNYADGISRLLFENPTNMALWLSGDKDFNAKTDLMVLNSFIGAKSNFDARMWSKIEDDLKERQRVVNMLKENNPIKYADYLAAHPLDQMLVTMYNEDVNGHLRDLRTKANEFRAMPGLSPKDRKAIVDAYVLQQNLEKFRLVQLYKAMGVEP